MTPAAVLFDLDGTLYDSGPLRTAMATELLCHSVLRGPGALRRVRAFRKQFESLRELGHATEPLRELRYQRAAEACGASVEQVRETIEDWMVQRPRKHLGAAMRRDLPGCLARLRGAGMKLGVLSDHPVEVKLRALGVRDAFDQAVSAMDPDVNAMKPHPRGLELVCERWGVEPGDVVYVGDRADVDGRLADAAGARAVLVGVPGETGYETVLNFTELADRLLS